MWGVRTSDESQNSRPSELPTHVGTPDPQGIWKLAVGLWSSGMNTGHVRYDQDSEPSKSVKRETSKLSTIAGTSDRRNFRLTSELPMNQPENHKNFIMAGHIPDTCQISKTQVSSFVSQILKTHMGWLEHLWNIIYQHDASLLIVRYSY